MPADVGLRAARTGSASAEEWHAFFVAPAVRERHDALRQELAPQRLEQVSRSRVVELARDHNFARTGGKEVEGHEELAEGRRIALEQRGVRTQAAFGARGDLALAAQFRQTQQVQSVHAVARRQRTVLRALEAGDEALVIRSGGEEAAQGLVLEALRELALELERRVDPTRVEVGLVEIDQPWIMNA